MGMWPVQTALYDKEAVQAQETQLPRKQRRLDSRLSWYSIQSQLEYSRHGRAGSGLILSLPIAGCPRSRNEI
jgi:hypothetical protein